MNQPEMIAYSIVHSNDRNFHNIATIKDVMNDFTFLERREFSDLDQEAYSFLNSNGIPLTDWSKTFAHSFDVKQACVITDLFIRALQESVGMLLVVEDDCRIDDSFLENLDRAKAYDFDLFNFSYLKFQWDEWGSSDQIIDDFSVRANFKHGLLNATLYSEKGMLTIIKILKRVGFIGSYDRCLEEWGRYGSLNCLSVNPDNVPSLGNIGDM